MRLRGRDMVEALDLPILGLTLAGVLTLILLLVAS